MGARSTFLGTCASLFDGDGNVLDDAANVPFLDSTEFSLLLKRCTTIHSSRVRHHVRELPAEIKEKRVEWMVDPNSGLIMAYDDSVDIHYLFSPVQEFRYQPARFGAEYDWE